MKQRTRDDTKRSSRHCVESILRFSGEESNWLFQVAGTTRVQLAGRSWIRSLSTDARSHALVRNCGRPSRCVSGRQRSECITLRSSLSSEKVTRRPFHWSEDVDSFICMAERRLPGHSQQLPASSSERRTLGAEPNASRMKFDLAEMNVDGPQAHRKRVVRRW